MGVTYPAGDQPEAGLLHEVAGAQDGPQRQRGLVEGGDQRQPGHHQELLDAGHPDTRPRQVEILNCANIEILSGVRTDNVVYRVFRTC